ncbi:MAG TPA: MFS transporter [Baekduia sp.]|nr:MFS transporter [Baekduia sp.]
MRLRPGIRRAGLYTGGFLGPFGGGMVVVLVPEFRDVFGVSTATAALAITAYLVPFALLQFVSGTLGERLGRDRVLRIAFAVYALASLAAAIFKTIEPFLIARAIQGCANAFTSPLALAKLADVTPPARLDKAMGAYASVQTSGMLLAPLIGGAAGAIDYRLAFVIAAVASLVLMVIVPEGSARPDRALAPRLRSAFTPRAMWMSASSSLFFLCTVGLAVVVSLKAADEFGVSSDGRGLLLAGFGFAGVFAGLLAGSLLERFGRSRVLVCGVISSAVVLSLLGFTTSSWSLAVVWFLTGLFTTFVATALVTLVVTASAVNRGGAISMIAAWRFVGGALAPVIWVPLYHASEHAAFSTAAGGTLIVLATALRASSASDVRADRPGSVVEAGDLAQEPQ